MKYILYLILHLCASSLGTVALAQRHPATLLFYVDNVNKDESAARCLPQLKMLCKHYGLNMKLNIIGYEMEKSQQQLEKETAMDKSLDKKFGLGFRNRLLKKADSLFVATSQKAIIPFEYCDYWPHPASETEDQYKAAPLEPIRAIGLEKKLWGQLRMDEYGNAPSFSISFTVSKKGMLSRFKTEDNFVSAALKNNRLLFVKLKSIVQKTIMQEAPWVAGKIASKAVTTSYTLTVNFYKISENNKTMTYGIYNTRDVVRGILEGEFCLYEIVRKINSFIKIHKYNNFIYS